MKFRSIKVNKIIGVMCILFSLLFLGNETKASAQLATLNSSKVLSSIPVMSHLDSLISKKQQTFAQDYNDEYFKTQRLIVTADSFKKAAPSATETLTATKKAEMAQKDLGLFETEANKIVKGYRDSLMQPYYNRVNAIIKEIAQKRNFKQVVDVQQVALLYADPSADITEEVIAELKK